MTGINYPDFVQSIKENGIYNISFTTVIDPDIPHNCPTFENYTVRKCICKIRVLQFILEI